MAWPLCARTRYSPAARSTSLLAVHRVPGPYRNDEKAPGVSTGRSMLGAIGSDEVPRSLAAVPLLLAFDDEHIVRMDALLVGEGGRSIDSRMREYNAPYYGAGGRAS